MNKYKIIALFGPAGSGKDYIQKHIMQTAWGKTYLNQIISCTTRPPRDNEKNGIDYYFVKKEDFFKQNLIEFTYYKDWFYGTSIDCLDKDKINIGVFNIQGIQTLLNNENCEILPIKIQTNSDRTRLLRQLNRQNNPNCFEICRRFISDRQDFFVIPFPYKIVENNTEEVDPVILDIIDLAESKWPD